ncbi:hypothetical protein [Bradyrhizobium sp. STM 3557]|uniref:hypothetical protein n=1 Tax=Bradyrhizobium sp. STM 3557 TaxID=578920 RepID=UPI003890B023
MLQLDTATAPRLACRDDRAQRPSHRGGMCTSSTFSVKTKEKNFAMWPLGRLRFETAREMSFSARVIFLPLYSASRGKSGENS